MKQGLRIFLLMVFLTALLGQIQLARAESEDACAIWICLPGGFPQGCGAAYSEFKRRIKKGRDPLPRLSSCTTGPNGETVTGNYELGYERWETCSEGFVLREPRSNGSLITGRNTQAFCYVENCAPEYVDKDNPNLGRNRGYCESYQAIERTEPHFVKMWTNGDYLGQFFYAYPN